jgi:hypothetical protein
VRSSRILGLFPYNSFLTLKLCSKMIYNFILTDKERLVDTTTFTIGCQSSEQYVVNADKEYITKKTKLLVIK